MSKSTSVILGCRFTVSEINMHVGYLTVHVLFLFCCLPQAEGILSKSRYLAGSQLTEADIRLFVTLIRFDMVYVGHFKVSISLRITEPYGIR